MSTELRAEVPPEPAVGSVVLDRNKAAWQRIEVAGWSRVGRVALFAGAMTSWSGLLVGVGPVRLIWDGATGAAPVVPEAQTTGGPGPAYTTRVAPVGGLADIPD